MENKIIEILACGAKNSAIARALKERGYGYFVYGWDHVDNGYYCKYDNDRREWIPVCVAELDYINNWVPNPDFLYRQDITSADVPALKKLYGLN